MSFSSSEITGSRVNSISNIIDNPYFHTIPRLPREFRVEGQIEHVPNRQITHNLPIYVPNDVLRNYSRSQKILYILLCILSMRDMALYLQSEANLDAVD